MIFDTAKLADSRFGVRKVIGHAVLLCLAFAVIAPAAGAHDRLSKRQARAQALEFVAPFVDLVDQDETVKTYMTRARNCRRINRVTVACRFAFIYQGSTHRGRVVAHLQRRDDLLGFKMTGEPASHWYAD